MTTEELTEIIKESNLLPFQIAEAVGNALEEQTEKYFNNRELKQLLFEDDYIMFYFAAKRFGK